MIAEQQSITAFLDSISRMKTAEDIRHIGHEKAYFYEVATAEEACQIRDAIRLRNAALQEEARRESDESLKLLTASGFILDTTIWLTIKRYADKYGLSQQVVVNWINRGVIPAEAVQDVPELNNMRLVKDQLYR
jgi:hypothetical protein